jgi:hypothetical protein
MKVQGRTISFDDGIFLKWKKRGGNIMRLGGFFFFFEKKKERI